LHSHNVRRCLTEKVLAVVLLSRHGTD
jgi:hypothetical protein